MPKQEDMTLEEVNQLDKNRYFIIIFRTAWKKGGGGVIYANVIISNKACQKIGKGATIKKRIQEQYGRYENR